MIKRPIDLQRFLTAQAPMFEIALAELRAGQKRSHWIWFIFPQLRDLGRSWTAQFYGIASLDEARAYLAHPVLGTRLELATLAVLSVKDLSVHQIFGWPDDLKFHSSITLFALASSVPGNHFREALDRLFSGRMDEVSLNCSRTRARSTNENLQGESAGRKKPSKITERGYSGFHSPAETAVKEFVLAEMWSNWSGVVATKSDH
jgi:uncharacterized protein (DUF1810 family)